MAEIFSANVDTDLTEFDTTTTGISRVTPGMDSSTGMMACSVADGRYGTAETLTMGATHLTVKFYFDPNTLTMATNEAFYIMTLNNSSGTRMGGVRMRWDGGDYQITTNVTLDSGSGSNESWTDMPDLPQCIEFQLVRPTSSISNDGQMLLYIDNVAYITGAASRDFYNNFPTITEARFGSVESVDAGTSGTIYFDEISIRDDSTLPGATQTVYYMATTGSDSGAGGFNDPWLTKNYAIGQLSTSHTLRARGGTYGTAGESATQCTTDATSGTEIILENYNAETPIFDGTLYPGSSFFIQFRADYWILDGWEFRYFPVVSETVGVLQVGVSSVDYPNFLTIQNCRWYQCGRMPIRATYCRDSTFDNNQFEENKTDAGGTYGFNAFNFVGGDCRDCTISNNTFLNNYGDGLHFGNSVGDSYQNMIVENNTFEFTLSYSTWFSGENHLGIKETNPAGATNAITIRNNVFKGCRPTNDGANSVKGGSDGSAVICNQGSENVIIESNWFEDNTVGVVVDDSTTNDVDIYNNIFIDCLNVSAISGSPGRPQGYGTWLKVTNSGTAKDVYFNTVINSSRYLYLNVTATITNFKNNAIDSNSTGFTNTNGPNTVTSPDYNAWENFTPDALVQGANDISPTSFNLNSQYTPQTGSALLGAGVAIGGITDDYDGTTRGSPPDIGAREGGGAAANATAPLEVLSLKPLKGIF